MKIGLKGAGLLHADLVTDGRTYDEANSRFLAFWLTYLNVLRDLRFSRRNAVEDQVFISVCSCVLLLFYC